MIIEYTKTTRRTIKLPDQVRIGDESFSLKSSGPNQLTVVVGAWETTYHIENPEEFLKDPTHEILSKIQSMYDDIHDCVFSPVKEGE